MASRGLNKAFVIGNLTRELRSRFDVAWAESAGRRLFYRFYQKGTPAALL